MRADNGHVSENTGFFRRRNTAAEDGFTLMECVVALMIATLMFLALAMSLGTSLRASLSSRQNQAAIDMANDQLEQLRSLDFAALAMRTTDTTFGTDTCASGTSVWCATSSSGSLQYPNPSGGSPLTEPLYTAAGGAVTPHVKACRPGSIYTCKLYITSPTDANAVSYRRASVVVQWTNQAGTHTRFSSSFVTASRRGLPSPAYNWAATPNSPNSVGISPGGRGAFFAMLTNQGVQLRWNLTATIKVNTVPQSWPVQWFQDTDCSGSWNSSTETTALDSDGNGIGDTGIVPTDGRICVVAVVYVPTGQATGTASVSLATAPVTATPATDYTVAGPVTATANISSSGVSYRTLSLHNWSITNGPVTGDSNSPANGTYNVLSATAPTPTALYNFDADRNAAPGVTISTTTPATWRYGVSNQTTFGGTASLDFYAVSDDLNAFTSTNVTITLRAETATGVWSPAASVTVPVTGSTSFAHLSAAISMASTQVPASRNVELQISVPAGSTPVRLAYDSSGAPATLVLPYTSGNP